jgi:FkbM family methyltransferase
MERGTPNSPMSVGTLENAMQELGSWDVGRDRLVSLMREFEAKVPLGSGVDVRETVTGPILDAAFGHGRALTKKLSSGLTFSVRYTSKIVRDFIMSEEAVPDHVWEPQTTKALMALTKNASAVVIGGAYFGDHAILIADQLRDKGAVHCFELSQDSLSLLETNVRQNSLSNVEINAVGLWSSDTAKLVLEGDDSHASPRESDAGFDTTTINSYAGKRGIRHLDLIMLDIEGAEFDALKGASDFLSQSSETAPDIVFEIHGAYTDWSNGLGEADIVRLLRQYGYEVLAIRDYHSNVNTRGQLVELVDCESAYIEGPRHGFNMLATKRLADLDPMVFKRAYGVSPKLLKHKDQALHGPT